MIPACVTVNVCPATVNVPLRCDVEVLACTEYPTVPFPLPLPPDVMLIQLALLDATQPHPVGDVTDTEYEPPPLGTFGLLVGLME